MLSDHPQNFCPETIKFRFSKIQKQDTIFFTNQQTLKLDIDKKLTKNFKLKKGIVCLSLLRKALSIVKFVDV